MPVFWEFLFRTPLPKKLATDAERGFVLVKKILHELSVDGLLWLGNPIGDSGEKRVPLRFELIYSWSYSSTGNAASPLPLLSSCPVLHLQALGEDRWGMEREKSSFER